MRKCLNTFVLKKNKKAERFFYDILQRFFFFFYCRWKLSSWIKSPFLENKKGWTTSHKFFFFSLLSHSLSPSHIVALYTKATEKVHHQLNQGIFLETKSGLEIKGKKKAILKMSVLSRLVGWEGWVPKPNFSCIYIIGCVCIRGCKMVFWI